MKKNYLILFLMMCGTIKLLAQTSLPSSICNMTLTMAGSPYTADSSITIGNGCTLTINPGVEIKMADSSFMIVKGNVNFLGTASQPIRIHAKNTNWGVIYLDNTGSQKSTFDHVIIEDATIGPHGNTHADSAFQIAAISGSNCIAEINHCVFKNNKLCLYFFDCHNTLVKNSFFDSTNVGEKIHIEMSDSVTVDSCKFYFTAGTGDVVDFDSSVMSTISNNKIYGGDSDGLDIGNSDSTGCTNIFIHGNFICGMGDKGISPGEHCTNIKIDHNVIVNCDFGISAKAGAQVVADHNTFYHNRIGVRSCACLPGWGPGNMIVKNSIIASSIDSTWSVDPSSTLTISYSLADMDLIPGIGNVQGNPMFVFSAIDSTGDFHLNAGSPAIDSGDPSFANDADGTRTDMGAFYFDQSAGIFSPDNAKKFITIYPNPAYNSITVSIDPQINGRDYLISISDVLGREIFRSKLSDKRSNLDISKLSPGIYGVRILSGAEIKLNEKIVVQ
jgi:hypothetical protein